MSTFSDRQERADEREQAREDAAADPRHEALLASIDALGDEGMRWRSRALAAEEALRARPGRLAMIRGDWHPARGQRARLRAVVR